MTIDPTNPTSEQLLAELRRALPRTRRCRDLLSEIRDGLEDAVEAYRRAGLPATAAEQRAVADFGDPAPIADLCRDQLVVDRTARAAVVVGAGFPAVLACWGLFGLLFGTSTRLAGGHPAGGIFADVGLATAVIAGLTLIACRWSARAPRRRTRPVAIAFAVVTLAAIGATYLLATVSHAHPQQPAEILAHRVAQGVSLAVTLVMLAAVASVLRHIPGRRHPTGPRFSNVFP